jgi:hypothetical protein
MLRRWLLVTVALAVLTLLGFSSFAEGQQPRKIDIAVPALSPASTTFAVARKQGYYRDEGLHVELVVIPAAMLSIPSNFMAEEAGFRELVSFIKQDLVELQGSIVVSEGLQTSDPVLVEKFVRGSLKGLLYFRANRIGTISILTPFLRVKEDEVGRIYDLILPGVTQDGTVGEDMQRKSLEHILERVGLKESPSLDKIFNYALARKIYDDLHEKGWRP